MRPDGTRVRDLTPIAGALPHIMPKGFNAQNWAGGYTGGEAVRREE